VSESSWDAQKYEIAAESGDRNRRKTALAKQINADESGSNITSGTIPVSLGRFSSAYDADGNALYRNFVKVVIVPPIFDRFQTRVKFDPFLLQYF
jgi:hypothetical protein